MNKYIEKILVCGDINGKFLQLHKRITSVHQKSGPFSLVLCVGEFFGENNDEWELFLKKVVKMPIPVFILGPLGSSAKPYYDSINGCELTENIIYLGPCGVYPCSSGLKIAYLSGTEIGENAFTPSAIKTLESAVDTNPAIDILITSEWPREICKYAVKRDDMENKGSVLVSHLLNKLKPRYHFVRSDFFYERLPYRNHKVLQESGRPVTRFISVASVGNPQKEKWMYAFSIVPFTRAGREINEQPPDVTENPFSEQLLYEAQELILKKDPKSQSNQFFYDMSAPVEDNSSNWKRKRKNDSFGENKNQKAGPCWFCLASPEVEKHLVVSVGNHCYLALAKGGLVPFHLLILPIEHFRCSPDLKPECLLEISQFKKSLLNMFRQKNQTCIFFERNYKSQHLQIQVVPVKLTLVPYIKSTFMDVSENLGLIIEEIPKESQLSDSAEDGTPFFYVELPTGEKLYHKITKGFPLQFAREVLACPTLLNIPERVDWRECKLSTEEETKIRDEAREAFKPFDFTLDDSDDED